MMAPMHTEGLAQSEGSGALQNTLQERIVRRIQIERGVDQLEGRVAKNPVGIEIGRLLRLGCTFWEGGPKCPETGFPLVSTPNGRLYSVGNECYYQLEGAQLARTSAPVATTGENPPVVAKRPDHFRVSDHLKGLRGGDGKF